ncbi:MAG: PIN domain-containing protein [Treponema sp.]|jgi:predicted nucleic acid-binding protein|nr:PIN domain-containing protein [Treponema sp.]
MKVLIDSNIALNKLLKQPEFFAGSNTIFNLAEIGQITGYISASAVTDIYYIARKSLGKTAALKAIKKMLQVFQPATVTGDDIYKALELEWDDFEDSVQFIVGESLSVDYIITRNTKDFSSDSNIIVTPEQFLEIITNHS